MMPIKVNISDVSFKYDLTEQESLDLSHLIVTNLANSYAYNMKALAKTELHQTRQAFIDGIRVIEISQRKAAVELIGFIPNAVTIGTSAFDMKIGLLKSAKAKISKDGSRYISIPFRLANPDAVASSTIFSGTMPDEIYKLAKKLQGKKQLNKAGLPAGFDEGKTRPAYVLGDGEVKYKYKHKHSIYEGLTKSTKSGHSQYNTFRTVSDNSDTDSWIHKGFESRNIHLRAMEMLNVDNSTKMIIDSYLDQIR